jgi:DeoR/GlpR family transcriptional regulator of sugar metabolism
MSDNMTVFIQRELQFLSEKKLIGYYAAFLLRNEFPPRGVAIDGGTTNYYVIEAICCDVMEHRQTVPHVLTNNFKGLIKAKDIPEGVGPIWYCTGGQYRKSRESFFNDVVNPVMPINCSTAVIGANGLEGLSLQTTTRTEHPIKHAMIKMAHYVIFPIDPSKWGYTTGTEFANISGVVKKGKRVSLVTCFPIPELNEKNTKLNERIKRLPEALKTIISLWDTTTSKYKLEVRVSEAGNDLSDFKEFQFAASERVTEDLLDYCKKESEMGKKIVIRLDLFEEKYSGSR